MRTIEIGNHKIGPNQPVYVIAECGANHEGDIETAEQMIVQAARGGASCVKFQTYTAGKLVTRTAPRYWQDPEVNAEIQYDLFDRYDKFGEAEWRQLINKAKESGITFMSSAWDEDSVDMLDELGMTAFKIGSADITTLPLISHIASKGKPVFISTGASSISEIDAAISTIRETGNENVIPLHCILSYPTQYIDANLEMMVWLQSVYPDLPIGYSDHTLSDPNMTVPIMAAAKGARAIEKHFTLDKSVRGNDHFLSMDLEDLERWTASLKIMDEANGKESYRRVLETEEQPRNFARRSLVSRVAIPKATTITRDMLTYKRPGTGISPADLYLVVGRRLTVDVPEDQTLTWDLF